ncbi:MAG: hypothetical protein GXO25_00505 [Euryarchaeota archaeon]|nr:hypothetical protein [Euryarchaeota archaeon]
MNVFVSGLTVYTYDNEERYKLNMEEANKFSQGLRHARDIKRVFIFTDAGDILSNIDSSDLTNEERNAFKLLVINQLEILRFSGIDVVFIDSNLTDYESVMDAVEVKLGNLISSGTLTEVYLNLSSGHKVGALAMYVKLLNMVMRRKDVILHPYHAERGMVEELPVIDLMSSTLDVDKERYLEVFAVPKGYLQAKMEIESKVHSERDAEEIIIYFTNRKLIEKKKEDEYVLSVRGRTLLALNDFMNL